MDIQRLRNLTTGRLHTKVEHIYQDIGRLTGAEGIMTHQIPNALRAMEPWIRTVVTDQRFWDGKHDPEHVGHYDVPCMTDEETKAMFARYQEMPSLLAGKKTIVVET